MYRVGILEAIPAAQNAANLDVLRKGLWELPVINLKTAKALGLTIPQSLVLRADEVIQ